MSNLAVPWNTFVTGNGCADFMGAWRFWCFLLENPPAHKIPRLGDGGSKREVKCQFYFSGRGDFFRLEVFARNCTYKLQFLHYFRSFLASFLGSEGSPSKGMLPNDMM